MTDSINHLLLTSSGTLFVLAVFGTALIGIVFAAGRELYRIARYFIHNGKDGI